MIFSKLCESTNVQGMYADDYFEMADVEATFEEYALINQSLNMCMEALMIADITIDEQMLSTVSEAILIEGADPADAEADAQQVSGEESEKVSGSFKAKVKTLVDKTKSAFANFSSKVKSGLSSAFKNDAIEKYGEALANYTVGEKEIKVNAVLPNLKAGDSAAKKAVKTCLSMIKNPYRKYGADSYPSIETVRAAYNTKAKGESIVSKKLVDQCMTILKNKSTIIGEIDADEKMMNETCTAASSAIGKVTKESSSAAHIIEKCTNLIAKILTVKTNAYKEAAKTANSILNKVGSGKAEKATDKANAKAEKAQAKADAKAARKAAKEAEKGEPAQESYNDLFTRFLNGEI